MVSKHSKNLAAAAALVQYMTTSNAYQATAPTYPAYKPAAAAWLANQAQQTYFAASVAGVFTQAANEIWGGWGAARYSQENIWASTMVPQITNGKTISSLLGTWQTAIQDQVTLIVMLMPSAALVLPLFLEMNFAHQIGSVWSVILPFSLFPFGVYLVYIYFSSHMSKDLLAAARLDGCSELQVFRLVALPLAKPVIALVAFFSFVGNWNNFFLPLVMLPSTQAAPIQVGLNNLLASTPAFNPVAGGADLSFNRPELALTTLLAIAPILLVFLFAQRALVSGMLAGATKE